MVIYRLSKLNEPEPRKYFCYQCGKEMEFVPAWAKYDGYRCYSCGRSVWKNQIKNKKKKYI